MKIRTKALGINSTNTEQETIITTNKTAKSIRLFTWWGSLNENLHYQENIKDRNGKRNNLQTISIRDIELAQLNTDLTSTNNTRKYNDDLIINFKDTTYVFSKKEIALVVVAATVTVAAFVFLSPIIAALVIIGAVIAFNLALDQYIEHQAGKNIGLNLKPIDLSSNSMIANNEAAQNQFDQEEPLITPRHS